MSEYAYIVTIKRLLDPCGIGTATLTTSEAVSRRAFATLDEARETAGEIVYVRYASWPQSDVWDDWTTTALSLPESGGTVGPLPDGTVIEVEAVEWGPVAKLATAKTRSEIVEAFNAQETRS